MKIIVYYIIIGEVLEKYHILKKQKAICYMEEKN